MKRVAIHKYIVALYTICMIMVLVSCGEKPIEPASENTVVSGSAAELQETCDMVDLTALKKVKSSSCGFTMKAPDDAVLDDSLSESFSRLSGKGYSISFSYERCPYNDIHPEMTEGLARLVPWYEYNDAVDQYIGYYESRFLLNEDWQKNNNVTVTHSEKFNAGKNEAIIFHADINDASEAIFDGYSYVFVKTDATYYIRFVFRYQKEDTAFRECIKELFSDFKITKEKRITKTDTDFYPVIPDNWSEETRALYGSIASSDSIKWGIFSKDIYGKGINETIPELEEKLEYSFPVVLTYIHSIHEFPTEFMEKAASEGRIVELTYQITDNNNENLFARSVSLDIYRGTEPEEIRAFARKAKEFGKPFLFRLCNEMNSDWTSYGGVNNMADPDIFIANWRRIYDIFKEEGVNNCIWIFNPNDRNAPPNNWNDSLAYYPGNEYVQMIGVTGYNNGTYYKKWGEQWREFKDIYNLIQNEYGNVFGKFPWIITEFASSSIGGNKVKWIDSMFENIGNYPNIKIAVWFNYADFDSDGTAARPYWLDETEATLNAFKRGLAQYK